MMWVWTKTLSALRAFGVARGGNVAITFAFATLPIIATVGYAVDYSRANSVKVAMQAALDSTALMISKEAVKDTPTQLQDNAKAYFLAMFNRSDVKNITVTTTYDSANPTQVAIRSSVDVPTTFLAAVGWDTMTVGNSSTVKWGSSRLRVALVLDNTGSMAQGGTTPQTSKLAALQTATANLLTQLKNAAAVPGDVYVSIIPFVKDVNLGASNYASNYLDWTEWEGEPPILDTANGGSKPSNWYTTAPGSSCPFGTSTSTYGFRCTNGPATSGASNINTIPSSGNYNGLICPGLDAGNKKPLKANDYYNGCYNSWTKCIGSACACTTTNTSICGCTGTGSSKTCKTKSSYYDHTWRPSASNTYTPALVLYSGVPYAAPAHNGPIPGTAWNGCVMDRGFSTTPDTTNNYDTNVTQPDVTKNASLYAAEQYGSCPQASMGLSYDWTAMNSLVTDMAAAGNTNQAIGLQLGWMSLVGAGPFTAPPMDPNYTYSQVIILLTDGLNTQDRWYTSQSSIDARQQLTCNNINAAGITLYTIQVDTDGEATSKLLQNCAGSPGTYPDSSKFFLLTSPNAIVTTFNQIGTKLSNLYVAK
jgi:Flp pilus assembly protein TadG